jgi:hypothetical protein
LGVKKVVGLVWQELEAEVSRWAGNAVTLHLRCVTMVFRHMVHFEEYIVL